MPTLHEISHHFGELSDSDQDTWINLLDCVALADRTLKSALYKDPINPAEALIVIRDTVQKLNQELRNPEFIRLRQTLNKCLDQVIIDDINLTIEVIPRILAQIQNLPSPNPNST